MEEPFQKLPWTHEGLMLLNKIESIIEANGGNEAMVELISLEMTESTYQRDKRFLEDAMAKMYKYKVTNKEAADILHIDYNSYCRMFLSFKSKMNLNDP